MKIARTILALTAVVLMACTSQKEPAENALAKVEASLNEVRADAEQYAAEELKAADQSIANLKSRLANKEYRLVVIESSGVATRIDALKTTIAEAKANAEATLAAAQTEWNDLSASVPPLVEKLQARVDQLTRTRKYPKGMDKAAFEAAKSGFETLKTEWSEAGNEFAAGQAANAVRKARNAKARAEELMNTLEVQA
jgi:hypothetical protein